VHSSVEGSGKTHKDSISVVIRRGQDYGGLVRLIAEPNSRPRFGEGSHGIYPHGECKRRERITTTKCVPIAH